MTTNINERVLFLREEQVMVILAVERITRTMPDEGLRKPWLIGVREVAEELGEPWTPKLVGWRLKTLGVNTRKRAGRTFAYIPKEGKLIDRITWTRKIGSLWGFTVDQTKLGEALEILVELRDAIAMEAKLRQKEEKQNLELDRVLDRLREQVRGEKVAKEKKLCYNENYATRSDPSYPSGTPPEDKDASGVGGNDAVCVHAEDTQPGSRGDCAEPGDATGSDD